MKTHQTAMTTLLYIFVCGGLSIGWLACNPTPTAPPKSTACSSDDMCASGQKCTAGLCTVSGIKTQVDGGERATERSVTQDADIQVDTDTTADTQTDASNSIERDESSIDSTEPSPPDVLDPDRSPDTSTSSCLENETRSCFTFGDSLRDVGMCKSGQQICKNGKWGLCTGEQGPSKELCDKKDNDCDGKIDEDFQDLGKPCSVGKGVCVGVGVLVCATKGQVVVCDAKVQGQLKTAEVCDGKDNDCDGKVDNVATVQPCSIPGAQGACAVGEELCLGGQLSCVQKVSGPTPEVCNGIDDDCDGKTDEDFPGVNQPCFAGQGECKASGSWTCSASGKTVECSAKQLPPTAEICDGKDNDCNGIVDDNCNCVNNTKRPCFSGSKGCSLQSDGSYACVGVCKAGEQVCKNGKWGACTGEIPLAAEVCDGKDNDCNGRVDDGIPQGAGCTVAGALGECQQGHLSCVQGQMKCTSKTPASTEICDGKDNDCDGQIDNGVAFSSPICTVAGKKGRCAEGKPTCVQGQLQCQQVHQPSAEICNNKDDNCNGQIDEGNPGGGAACSVASKLGVCAEGKMTCYQGQMFCYQVNQPTTELCDKKDNNCDGLVDNGLPCRLGQTICGGGGNSILKCRNDCRGYQYAYPCNVINREFCNNGQCKKCPCFVGDRRCRGKEGQVCTFKNGICGWYRQFYCPGSRVCRENWRGQTSCQ